MDDLKGYRGNKGYQHAYMEIINLIPFHKAYWELFAGYAGIYRNICPAEKSSLNDIDPTVISKLKTIISSTDIYNQDALQLLKNVVPKDTDNFVYLDPPYPKSSRRSSKDIYNYEMSDFDHVQLLKTIKDAKYNCMISTYENDIYKNHLKDWNLHTFKTSVHGKVAVEYLYYNYDKPEQLHDYRYLGSDCWDRQRIKRKVYRHIQKLSSLPAAERNCIIQEINKNFMVHKDKNDCSPVIKKHKQYGN